MPCSSLNTVLIGSGIFIVFLYQLPLHPQLHVNCHGHLLSHPKDILQFGTKIELRKTHPLSATPRGWYWEGTDHSSF